MPSKFTGLAPKADKILVPRHHGKIYVLAFLERRIAPTSRRSPTHNHHVLAVNRHRRPAIFLPEGNQTSSDPWVGFHRSIGFLVGVPRWDARILVKLDVRHRLASVSHVRIAARVPTRAQQAAKWRPFSIFSKKHRACLRVCHPRGVTRETSDTEF